MKKWLLGSVIGAILIFLWQFISWAALDLHNKEYKHVANQDQLSAAISSAITEDGQYALPSAAPGATQADKEKLMKDMDGKPFILVSYRAAYKADMVMPMIRSFLVDLVLVLIAIYVLGSRTNLSIGSVWAGSLGIGFIAWLWYPYTMHIWYQTPMEVVTGALMDWFVLYSILGLWLGFWLKRNP